MKIYLLCLIKCCVEQETTECHIDIITNFYRDSIVIYVVACGHQSSPTQHVSSPCLVKLQKRLVIPTVDGMQRACQQCGKGF